MRLSEVIKQPDVRTIPDELYNLFHGIEGQELPTAKLYRRGLCTYQTSGPPNETEYCGVTADDRSLRGYCTTHHEKPKN
ncbi:hypothetical protein AB0G15_05765 [Streptosporangium sp. NPDC023825]|uniref:hypothetical protein n=1 Tax=Streptosporangium sp. NPDC023825 TaxID=3154909 RepID=UPI003413FF23